MSVTTTRQPAGTLTGGQFADTDRARGSTGETAPSPRDDIDALAPGGHTNPAPAARTWGQAATEARAAEDSAWARGVREVVGADREPKRRRCWWQLGSR